MLDDPPGAARMRSQRTRSIIAVTTLVLALVAWLPGAAVAAEDSFRASGEASGFVINIPEVAEIATGRSEGDITSEAFAHGRGVGVLLADDSISEVTIEDAGVTRRDPESGENCATPQLPEPLDIVDAACSFAVGNTVDDTPRGLGDATGLELAVTGADVDALVAFLLSQIDEAGLQTAIDEVEASVLEPVRVELANACLDSLGELAALFEGANDLIDAIESNGVPVEVDLQSTDACSLLVQYVTDPPVLVDEDGDGIAGPDDILTQLEAELTAALEGVSLLDVLLGGSVSEGVATDADATGTSDATGLDIELPSLNLLGNVVDVLTTIVDDFLTEVEGDVSEFVTIDDVGVPALADLVDILQGAIPQELQDVLDDEDPLLQITGGKSTATAVYDRAAGEVTTDGQVQPLVLDLADSLATLLQLSDQDPISVPEGDSVTIAEGTPLESTAELATCTSEEASEDGLDGERISCAGLDLTLLKGVIGDDPETDELDGGINLAGARAEAAAFGAPAPAPEEPTAAPPNLPTTGGGAGLIGLVILGSVLALRRKH